MLADQENDNPANDTSAAGKKNAHARSAPTRRSEYLSALAEGAPKFKSGQVRALWPQIVDALARGHKLKQIWEWLSRDGLEVSYSRFRHCIADLKRSQPVDDVVGPRLTKRTPRQMNTDRAGTDPLANLRDRLNKRPGFEFDERPPDIKKLI